MQQKPACQVTHVPLPWLAQGSLGAIVHDAVLLFLHHHVLAAAVEPSICRLVYLVALDPAEPEAVCKEFPFL